MTEYLGLASTMHDLECALANQTPPETWTGWEYSLQRPSTQALR